MSSNASKIRSICLHTTLVKILVSKNSLVSHRTVFQRLLKTWLEVQTSSKLKLSFAMVNMYWSRNPSLCTTLFKSRCQRSGHHSQHSLHTEVSEKFVEYSLWVITVFCTYPRDTLWQIKKFFTIDNFSLPKWIPKAIFTSEKFLGFIISSIWNDGKVPKMLIYKNFPMKT